MNRLGCQRKIFKKVSENEPIIWCPPIACSTNQTEFLQDCKETTRTTHDTCQRRSTTTQPTHGMKHAE